MAGRGLAAIIIVLLMVVAAGCKLGAAKTEALIKQADEALASKKYNDAYSLYAQALERDPKNDTVLTSLAICCLELKEPDRGIEWADKALAVNPNNAMAWEKKGELVMSQRHLPDSVPLFKKALALDGNMNAARLNLSLVYEGMGNTDQALTLAKEAVSREPKNAETHYTLGRIQEQARNYDAAEDQFRQAIALKADHYDSLMHLAGLLVIRNEDLGKARQLAQQANKIRPGDGDPALLAAWALFQSGDMKSGAREMDQVARAHPTNWRAWVRLSMALKTLAQNSSGKDADQYLNLSKQAAKIAGSISPRPLAVLEQPGDSAPVKAPTPKGAR
jgi:tetratricopeptide (TPR) repeat protein